MEKSVWVVRITKGKKNIYCLHFKNARMQILEGIMDWEGNLVLLLVKLGITNEIERMIDIGI